MKKSIYNVIVITFSLSIVLLALDCACQNNALGAEIDFPEELLSQAVEWKKCELKDTEKMWRKAECADITVPLYWENPEGESMTIRVKRLKSWVKATKQLWLLEGGPGNAGTSTLHYMRTISRVDWRTDLYALDHRGTGNSNRLGCPDQEADDSEEGFTISESEWAACIDYLEDNYNLDALTVTQAAKDVGFIVELLREENKDIFVFCLSYGTYWGHRYAQIFPDQVAGVILDSVLPSVNDGFDQYDILVNDTAKDFFDICKEDDFCRSKMGDDPWEKANEAFEKLQNGHCAEVSEHGMTLEFLQLAAFYALSYWDLRIVLPALYYRLDRCNDKDVNALKYLLDGFSSQILPQSTESEIPSITHPLSWALRYHIGLSEIMSATPFLLEEIEGINNTLLASSQLSYDCLKLLERWPTYETDEYYQKWASLDVPILMLNGTLDQKTPIEQARSAKENLTGPNQYFIEVPNGIHTVIEYSPVKNIFAPACGTQIIVDYMKNPLTTPDTSCIADLKQIDFRGNPLLALGVFGTLDLWENGINANLSDDQIFQMEEEAARIKHDLRQRQPRSR